MSVTASAWTPRSTTLDRSPNPLDRGHGAASANSQFGTRRFAAPCLRVESTFNRIFRSDREVEGTRGATRAKCRFLGSKRAFIESLFVASKSRVSRTKPTFQPSRPLRAVFAIYIGRLGCVSRSAATARLAVACVRCLPLTLRVSTQPDLFAVIFFKVQKLLVSLAWKDETQVYASNYALINCTRGKVATRARLLAVARNVLFSSRGLWDLI